MAHPFADPKATGLRERVSSFVHAGLHRTAATNIIFVCGGDGPGHLRPKFVDYMKAEMPSYRPFRPEAAQADYLEQDHSATLNLSVFEELVSDLSLGIVLFPESPGSYAEAGLFSALENARRKTLMVMNAREQGPSSFLSFGPAAVIAAKSRLGPAIQMDYGNPDFSLIRSRIEDRLKVSTSFRSINARDFSDLEPIEIMSLIWFYVDLLKACSLEDIVYCFNSAFNAHAGSERIKQILSVLVGAELLMRDGPVALVRIADASVSLAEPSTSRQKKLQSIRLEVLNILEDSNDANYLEVMARAA